MLKKLFITPILFLFMSTCAYAHSIAVKLDFFLHDKNTIYYLVQRVGYSAKETKNLIPKANYHITIGYIDINNLTSAKAVANDIKLFLTKIIHQNHYFVSINKAINFGNYTVLDFDNPTKAALKQLNRQLDVYINQLSQQKKIKFSLNHLTQPNQYTPHWTINQQPTTQIVLQRLNKGINDLKNQRRNKNLLFNVLAINYSIV